MQLTLSQVLWLSIAIVAIVAIAFLTSLFAQLRKTARAGEETLIEIKELVKDLKETDQKIREKIDDVGEVIDASKKTAIRLSEITWFLTTKVIKPSSKYWPFLFPLLSLGRRILKKKKGG